MLTAPLPFIIMGKTIVEEVEGIVPQLVVARIFHNLNAIAREIEGDLHHFTNGCSKTLGHHHQPIGEEQGLINIVGHQQNCAVMLVPDVQ